MSQEVDENRYKRNVPLTRDIKNYEVIFGKDAVEYRYRSIASSSLMGR